MRKLTLCFVLMSAFAFFGCSDEESKISAIEIETSITLNVNDSRMITVEVLPEGCKEQATFQWESSDRSVVEVNDEGQVTALEEGEGTITVRLADNPEIRATCVVEVLPQDTEDGLDLNATIEFEDPMLGAVLSQYDTNFDGRIQVGEALKVTELLISGYGITSLEGLEYFRNLEVLDASGNELSVVELAMNKKLRGLYLKNNKIRVLDVSKLELLETLDCSSNRLSEIDVTNNRELKTLRIAMNHEGRGSNGVGITSLDVTKNPKLETLDLYYTNVSKLDLSQNPELKWIDFGLTAYTASNCQPVTEIDFSNNHKLEHISCEARVRTYDMNGNLIVDKVGLSKIDVSMLPKLQYLNCLGNSIKTLDLSQNVELTDLNCSRNYIEALDVTNNPKLQSLTCEWNRISVLDLSKNTALKTLKCNNNRIGRLDISQTRMSYLLANDNQITEFVVGDKTFDTPEGQNKEPYLYINLNNNQLTSIDLSRQVNLAWLEVNENRLTALDISQCARLGGVLFNNNQVEDFNTAGLSQIWEIQGKNNHLKGRLELSHLELSKLYLEGNPKLEEIVVWDSFDEGCVSYIVDHITGKNEYKNCYTKDSATRWVKK